MRTTALATVAILAALAAAQERKKSDNEKLAGQTWSFEATKGELSRMGEFRTHEKKVFQRERSIGTIQTKGDFATLVVYGSPPLNGRIVVKKDGTAWRGVIDHGSRSKWSVVFRPKEETIKERPERKKGK